MNEFFDSLKSDLLDRRVTPLLGLLGLALLGAIVYAVLAGGSSSAPSATSAPATAQKTPGIAVTAVGAQKTAVAETTSGAAQQTRGAGSHRNPFAPLPGVKAASSASQSSASTASSASQAAASSGSSGGEAGSGSSSSGAGTQSGSSSEPSTSQSGGTQPQKKQGKPAKTYRVSILFGQAPAGASALTAGLTSYEELKRQQPLPSASQPLIVFRGVVAGGRSATFTIVGEAIPRGNGACQPSSSQCQAIDVKVGETEELEYVPLEGTPVNYELYVVKIEKVDAKAAGSASAASASFGSAAESKAGLRILHETGLVALPWLRYSRDGSVLVFKHPARAQQARAHASAWGAAVEG